MHITNRSIAYISNSTNPNTLGLIPNIGVGKCITENGDQEWNYDSSLPIGSRWVLKVNSANIEHFFLSRSSHTVNMQHSTPVFFEFNVQNSIFSNKIQLLGSIPSQGIEILQDFTGMITGLVNLSSPVAGDMFVTVKTGAGGIISLTRETFSANSYVTIPISTPFSVITNDTVKLELTLGGSAPAGTHSIVFQECKMNFSVLT